MSLSQRVCFNLGMTFANPFFLKEGRAQVVNLFFIFLCKKRL